MMITTEQYQKVYGFESLALPPEVDELDSLRDLASKETLKARRKSLKASLREQEMMHALQADRISLKFRWAWVKNQGEYGYILNERNMYVGRLVHQLTYYTPSEDTKKYKSTYIGPMPDWVREKHQSAKRYFKDNELFVFSRHKDFFDISEVVVPLKQASPLLVAMRKDDSKQYLLAAWGLEYELPVSLGGLLPDGS